MASSIVTHLGENLKWVASKNAHNAYTITFTKDGLAFDISSLVFSLVIRLRNSSTALVSLAQGTGITNGGATGILTITLTQAQAGTTLRGQDYFYQLTYVTGGFTFNCIQGGLSLNTDSNPESSTTSVSASVFMSGSNVNVAVTVIDPGAIDIGALTPIQLQQLALALSQYLV